MLSQGAAAVAARARTARRSNALAGHLLLFLVRGDGAACCLRRMELELGGGGGGWPERDGALSGVCHWSVLLWRDERTSHLVMGDS
eukprot:6177667-Pleurochrysis_carterae.AAC.1